uniref:Uncharacterized protein n=1 Tax=Setaria italica TaxID=4555 RepID=K3YF32_SETIT
MQQSEDVVAMLKRKKLNLFKNISQYNQSITNE